MGSRLDIRIKPGRAAASVVVLLALVGVGSLLRQATGSGKTVSLDACQTQVSELRNDAMVESI